MFRAQVTWADGVRGRRRGSLLLQSLEFVPGRQVMGVVGQPETEIEEPGVPIRASRELVRKPLGLNAFPSEAEGDQGQGVQRTERRLLERQLTKPSFRFCGVAGFQLDPRHLEQDRLRRLGCEGEGRQQDAGLLQPPLRPEDADQADRGGFAAAGADRQFHAFRQGPLELAAIFEQGRQFEAGQLVTGARVQGTL
jgi:hypothetical protein